MREDEDRFEVPAQPYKRFFIDVITRDLKIIDTFPEFVDNSIDGADRIREEGQYDGLIAEISFDTNQIEVKDNCGGIPRQLAEDYAFRFGRPTEIDEEYASSIGEFGVGMKRSIFKLGREFTLESNPVDGERFIISEDIEEWKQEEEEGDYEAWTFVGELIDSDDPRCELDEPGTRIHISKLTDDAKERCSQSLFPSSLKEKLRENFSTFMEDGFDISVNNDPLSFTETKIKQSDEIDVATRTDTREIDGSEVTIDIIAGLGESDPDEAGWYVYCNGRQVINADVGERTGWTGDEIPKFHDQYNSFRGFINFKSEDPGALPWNTSKTDINTDAGIYRTGKRQMIEVARPIIDFLNEVRTEQRNTESDGSEPTPLQQAVDEADLVSVNEVDTENEQDFDAPESEDITIDPDETTIQYSKETEKIRKLKQVLGVNSASDVGSLTFDHYYNNKVEK